MFVFRVASVRERLAFYATLIRTTAGNSVSNVVDVYDKATGLWSTAQLSQARHGLSATSVGTVAIFAGGSSMSKLLRILFFCCVRD